MNDTQLTTNISTKVKTSTPRKWKVIFHNDNSTTMDFVMAVLVSIFRYDELSAYDKAIEIHENNLAVIGIYYYEIAEQRSAETVVTARTAGFPLKVEIEPE